jgi:hypothetical protein
VAVHLPTLPRHAPRHAAHSADRTLRVALTAAAKVDAYWAAKQQYEKLLECATNGTGEVFRQLGVVVTPDAVEHARVAQRGATELAGEVAGRTPTLFFRGKVWKESMGKLERLIVHHPEALLPTPVSQREPRQVVTTCEPGPLSPTAHP